MTFKLHNEVFFFFQEYKEITRKRLKFLFDARPQPDQFSALVLAIPKDPDGKSYSDYVQEFFSKYHNLTYLSHQMVFSASKVEGIIVSFNCHLLFTKLGSVKIMCNIFFQGTSNA